MNLLKVWTVLAVIFFNVLLSLQQAGAKSFILLSRQKRLEQRFPGLKTFIALSQLEGYLDTIPVGFGTPVLDPIKSGRKNHSMDEIIKQLSRDKSAEENHGVLVPVRNGNKENAQNLGNKLRYINQVLRTDFNELREGNNRANLWFANQLIIWFFLGCMIILYSMFY